MSFKNRIYLIVLLFIVGCGNNTTTSADEPKTDYSYEPTLDNKGAGPYSDTTINLNTDIDQTMASNGEKLYNLKCISCHNMDSKLIGPALTGILNRRSPEWVMNMILTPDIMLKEDPDAIKMLKAYDDIPMLPLGLSDDEARQILEFLRS